MCVYFTYVCNYVFVFLCLYFLVVCLRVCVCLYVCVCVFVFVCYVCGLAALGFR